MSNLAPQSALLTTVLSVVLPVLGIAVWVMTLPSTRRLVTRRFASIREFFYGPTASEAPVEVSDTPDESVSGSATAHRRREDDPEIKKFDTSLFDRFKPST